MKSVCFNGSANKTNTCPIAAPDELTNRRPTYAYAPMPARWAAFGKRSPIF